MKKGIHPENYRPVVFKDMSNEDIFITRSTMPAKETIVVDGVEYPLIKVEISSTSRPFFTGKAKLVKSAADGVNDKVKDKTISMKLTPADGKWVCDTNLDNNVAPAACRAAAAPATPAP